MRRKNIVISFHNAELNATGLRNQYIIYMHRFCVQPREGFSAGMRKASICK